MNKRDLILIRPHTDSDLNFIYSTWMKGLRHGNDWFREIDNDAFKLYEQVIKNIIARGHISVAALKDDESVILGYSVTRPHIIDWVFVKPPWRGIGIATDLVMTTNPKSVSHLTTVGNVLRKKKNLNFNPFTI